MCSLHVVLKKRIVEKERELMRSFESSKKTEITLPSVYSRIAKGFCLILIIRPYLDECIRLLLRIQALQLLSARRGLAERKKRGQE